jgi:hypothetical protein
LFTWSAPKNVAVRFGPEFNCLVQPWLFTNNYYQTTINPTTTTTTTTTNPYVTTTTTSCPICVVPGYITDTIPSVGRQKQYQAQRPNPSSWKVIDFTSEISSMFINGYVTQESLTATTFVITAESYDAAPYYNLNDYIDLVPNGNRSTIKLRR